MSNEVVNGDGYAVGSLSALGEGPGFRKIRGPLGVTAYGMNALVFPPGIGSQWHWHERQEETYFVHQGTLEIEFGDDSKHVLEAGGIAHVMPQTKRRLMNVGDEECILVIVGGADGYVGRDGQAPEGLPRVRTLENA